MSVVPTTTETAGAAAADVAAVSDFDGDDSDITEEGGGMIGVLDTSFLLKFLTRSLIFLAALTEILRLGEDNDGDSLLLLYILIRSFKDPVIWTDNFRRRGTGLKDGEQGGSC